MRSDLGALIPDLVAAFRGHDLIGADTLQGLQCSLAGAAGPGIVVYLADWNIEDENGLEPLITDLRGRGLRFYTVGSGGLYDTAVGRSPFGPNDPAALLRCGDTAWPHLPFYWNGAYWNTKFPVMLRRLPVRMPDAYGRDAGKGGAGGTPEDLRERIDGIDPDALDAYHFPLPSGFGPYGFARLARETGGRYVLWSWNRAGRSTLHYDDPRCDLFAPDLRNRQSIQKDAAGRDLPRAIVHAWSLVANRQVSVARTTPALSVAGRPQEMGEPPPDGFLAYSWTEPADRTRMNSNARLAIEGLDRAIAILDAALSKAGRPADPIDRRYAADADLLRHPMLVHRFTIGETLTTAQREVPPDAWADRSLRAGLRPATAISGGPAPHPVVVSASAPIRNRELCERLRDDRERFIETYAGTPFAELVARNRVHTVFFERMPVAAGAPSRTSPADSSVRRGRTGPGSAPATPGTTGGQ